MSYQIQNVDRTATTKDYQHLASNEMLVHNTFYTLQGEGPFSGLPALFIRLAGCNFGDKQAYCGFCDTAFHLDNGRAMTFELLVEETKRCFSNPNYRGLVVITGGEPTLQRRLPAFVAHLSKHTGAKIQIETNGSGRTVLKELLLYEDSVTIISPKASRKGYGKLALEPQHNLHLKYVIEADSDSTHHTVPEEAHEFHGKGGYVWVSPIAVYKRPYTGEVANAWDPELIDHKRTSANYAYAAEYCMKHKFRLSLQQHLFCNLA